MIVYLLHRFLLNFSIGCVGCLFRVWGLGRGVFSCDLETPNGLLLGVLLGVSFYPCFYCLF